MFCRMRSVLLVASMLTFAAASSVAAQHAQRAGTKPVKLPANSAAEKRADVFSLERSTEFLDGAALAWTQQRKCAACHTNVPYLMVRPSLERPTTPAHAEVRKFFEDQVASWEKGRRRWDTASASTEVVVTATALAFNDAQSGPKLHPATRKALDKMWQLQRPDGSWNWLKCNWPPLEHDDFFGVVLAALAVGFAPEAYAETAKSKTGLEKVRQYFRANKPPDLHHKAMLLWASVKVEGLITQAERDTAVTELLALQRGDGGWSLPSLGSWKRRNGKPNDRNAESDGYGTGLVVHVLRQSGMKAEQEPIRRGIAWLKANQRVSGRWFTRSLNNDKEHFVSHAGTAFALMALCGHGE